jgi:hypothetical protein
MRKKKNKAITMLKRLGVPLIFFIGILGWLAFCLVLNIYTTIGSTIIVGIFHLFHSTPSETGIFSLENLGYIFCIVFGLSIILIFFGKRMFRKGIKSLFK